MINGIHMNIPPPDKISHATTVSIFSAFMHYSITHTRPQQDINTTILEQKVALILISAMQSASALCVWEGGTPKSEFFLELCRV